MKLIIFIRVLCVNGGALRVRFFVSFDLQNRVATLVSCFCHWKVGECFQVHGQSSSNGDIVARHTSCLPQANLLKLVLPIFCFCFILLMI